LLSSSGDDFTLPTPPEPNILCHAVSTLKRIDTKIACPYYDLVSMRFKVKFER
jgi:hypothetical protein